MTYIASSSDRSLQRLWDFGWLDVQDLTVSVDHRPPDFILRYIASDSFGTSFATKDRDSIPDIHGPFRRAEIGPDCYQLIGPDELWSQLERVRVHEEFYSPPSTEQWEPVLATFRSLQQSHQWMFMLRLDETQSEQKHEWGSVLLLFREFVFATPGSTVAVRAVFGYD